MGRGGLGAVTVHGREWGGQGWPLGAGDIRMETRGSFPLFACSFFFI